MAVVIVIVVFGFCIATNLYNLKTANNSKRK